MRVIRSFKDAEGILRRIEEDISALKNLRIPDIGDFVKRSEWNRFLDNELSRIVASSFRGATGSDIDIIPEQRLIVHNMDHRFLLISTNDLHVRDFAGVDKSWRVIATIDLVNDHDLLTFYSPFAEEYFRLERKLSGVTTNRALFSCDGTPITTTTYDLGETSLRWNKLWVKDIDMSGTATGFPSGDSNTHKHADASSSLSLTTSFQDVTGASVSLDKDGVWLIIINAYISRVTDDVDPQVTLSYDGTDETNVASIGISGTTSLSGSVSQTYVKTVSSQPKTAKLRGKKASGTGSSSVISGHSGITAVFLHT